MKISARNQFKGTIVGIDEGAVNGIVKIDIGAGNIVSATISMASIRELGLKVGGEAYAVVKATSVMVAVDVEDRRVCETGEEGKIRSRKVAAGTDETYAFQFSSVQMLPQGWDRFVRQKQDFHAAPPFSSVLPLYW